MPGEGALDRGLEVGVGQDDVRRLAAQLERHALERAARLGADLAPDRGRAGEGDLVDAGVVDQRRAGLAVAGDDVEHARRAARPRARARRGAARVSGVCSAGFSTIVQPAASAGRDLPGGHQQREVPRDDLPAHADRLLARVAEHVGRGDRQDARPRSSSASPRSSAGARRPRRRRRGSANFTGLPLSSDSSSASSSALASSESASAVMRRPRSAALMRRHGAVARTRRGRRRRRRRRSPPRRRGAPRRSGPGRRVERVEGAAVGGGAESRGRRRRGWARRAARGRVGSDIRAPGRSSRPRAGRRARRPLGVVKLHVVGDQRGRVETPWLISSSTRSGARSRSRARRVIVQRLDPQSPMCTSQRSAWYADDADDAAFGRSCGSRLSSTCGWPTASIVTSAPRPPVAALPRRAGPPR